VEETLSFLIAMFSIIIEKMGKKNIICSIWNLSCITERKFSWRNRASRGLWAGWLHLYTISQFQEWLVQSIYFWKCFKNFSL